MATPDHQIATATFNGHGHFVGRQGHTGHAMPSNDSHMQAGANYKAASFASGEQQADDPSCASYGIVDKGT